MEQTAIFEEKVSFTPKDMNRVVNQSIDSILLEHVQKKLEGKCSSHGFVIPKSISLLSRSMGHLENGRFTGNVIYYVQVQGNVYAPYNGMLINGIVLKKNKMGLYMIYNDSIRIIIPRDLHIGNDLFESIQTGEEIEVELRKSRFQINDPFILSVGVLKSRLQGTGVVPEVVPAVVPEEGVPPGTLPSIVEEENTNVVEENANAEGDEESVVLEEENANAEGDEESVELEEEIA